MAVVQLVVDKGVLFPPDEQNKLKLREMGLGIGEIVHAKITKPRNPRFHNLVHKLGQLCVQNIEGFESLTGHKAIKRLQYESGVCCEEMTANIPGVGVANIRYPKSLSFEDMDDIEFHELFRGICRHLAMQYWPDMEPEQIERMAEITGDE